MKSTRARKGHDTAARDAVYETMRLYHAWIGYLLTRLGEQTVRVQVEDVRRAMDRFQCAVSREGDAYVIRLAESDAALCREKGGCAGGDRDPSDDLSRGGEHGGE